MTPETAAVIVAALTVPQLPELARIIAADRKSRRDHVKALDAQARPPKARGGAM